MSATSRESYAGLRARLDQRRASRGLASLPAELFAAAEVIGSDSQLRSALSDSGQPEGARAELVSVLFGGRVSADAVEVLADTATQRWPSPAELLDAVEGLASQAAFLVAERAGRLDRVEDELFGFARAVSSSADLQMALSDPSVAAPVKSALVADLLAGRAADETVQVLAYGMSHLRGRRADAVVEDLMDLAAEQRDRSVAEVRVALDLDDSQRRRLAAALSTLHGREVRLNVAVDPDVIGGVSVRLGNEVIDGTVASRIEQARRSLVG